MSALEIVCSFLSWGGCILLLWGLKLIGEKKLSGFYIALVAEAMWIVWGFMTHSYALVVMSSVISAMYLRGIRLWKESP